MWTWSKSISSILHMWLINEVFTESMSATQTARELTLVTNILTISHQGPALGMKGPCLTLYRTLDWAEFSSRETTSDLFKLKF